MDIYALYWLFVPILGNKHMILKDYMVLVKSAHEVLTVHITGGNRSCGLGRRCQTGRPEDPQL